MEASRETLGEKTCLVLGGAKSGKSTYALKLAESYPPPRLFVATAQPFDDEMKEKIRLHRQQRKDRWDTVEEPLEVAAVIKKHSENYGVILLDCITLWISNLMLDEDIRFYDFQKILEELLVAIRTSNCPVIVVSNEVGMGIVPDTSVGRKFREFAGFANQELAKTMNEVVFCVAGLPLHLKK